MDLGKPGDVDKTDAIGAAKMLGKKAELVNLLERFKSDASQTRHQVRVELGWYDEAAAEVFALVVFVSDCCKSKTLPSVTCSQVLSYCRPASSGTPNGAVLPPSGIREGNHPRQRERGDIQGTGKKTLVIPRPLPLEAYAHFPAALPWSSTSSRVDVTFHLPSFLTQHDRTFFVFFFISFFSVFGGGIDDASCCGEGRCEGVV